MPVPNAESIKKRKQELSQLAKSLEDVPVGPDDKRYYPFHESPGEPRGFDVAHILRTAIDLDPNGGSCQLFSGFRGSGKSTELLRLRAELEADNYKVILVEGARIVNLHQPLEPADLLISVAAGVGLVLQENGKDSPAKRSVLERLASFFQNTNVTLGQLNAGASFDALGTKFDLGKIVLEIATNPSFKARVQDVLRGRLPELIDQFRAFMAEVRKLLVKDDTRCPVLLIDDLEKVRGTGPEQDQIQKGMEQIFWQFADALHIPGWHVIWTAPPYLQLLNSNVTTQYNGSVVLPMIRVWTNNPDRSPDEQGLAAVKACLRHRGDIDSLVFKTELLDRLILATSGYLRDLIGLLREVVKRQYMQKDPSEPLNEHQIDRIINDYVSTTRRAIYDEDIPWLRSIAEKRALTLPNAAMLARASKLIDTAMVMIYRNGETWFDVSHPARSIV